MEEVKSSEAKEAELIVSDLETLFGRLSEKNQKKACFGLVSAAAGKIQMKRLKRVCGKPCEK